MTSLSNIEVTVIQAFPEEIKATVQEHWVQFENIEIQDMKLWNGSISQDVSLIAQISANI